MHLNDSVVTRYAPSPTGFQHVGGIRTALFAWLWARKHNGTFILRIEDTDKGREVEGAIQHTIDALTWLGLEWDYGPCTPSPTFGSCLQSERLDTYREFAQKLYAQGLAYPDPYTNEEVAEFRARAEKQNQPFLFRNHRPDTFFEWDGTTSLRFKVPKIKRYEWHDAVRGQLSAGPEMLDDFIIMKADGYPTYNFAHVIDDHLMHITHVMRGEEFISSTPKFLSLYDALGFERPTFVTLPPIMGPDGKKKLSKRDGAKDLLEYRTDGYLPSAMVNFLALIGWNPGGDRELFTEKQSLMDVFALEKIQKSGGAFNEEKLRWLNREHLTKTLSSAEQVTYVQTAMPDVDTDIVRKLTPVLLERVHNQTEIREAIEVGEYDWVFTSPTYDTSLLQWKNDSSVTDVLPRLQTTRELLQQVDFSELEYIKSALWPYAEETGKGEVLWPLRVALSGRERSPDPFTLAYVIGQDETLARIATACAKIERDAP